MAGVKIITCIVQRGKADKVVKAAMAAGAEGATVFYARGTGVRQKLGILGAMLSPEKEVIVIGTTGDKSDPIFDAIVEAGKLDTPGKGFAFVQDADRAVGFLGCE